MSRIGKKACPDSRGVDVAVDGSHVTVKGPKGQLELDVYSKLTIEVADGVLTVVRPDDERETRARHGLTRALIANMVEGVSKRLHQGARARGRRLPRPAQGQGPGAVPGLFPPGGLQGPEGITFEVPDNTHINVKGIDKQQVGQVAAEIRGKRPPEPYKGKGIHYVGEHIRRKLGKAAK